MKIWALRHDTDFIDVRADSSHFAYFQTFEGETKAKDWKPIKVKPIDIGIYPWGNAVGLSSHIPVLDRTAVDVLRDLLDDNAEILPLDCEYAELYAINVTNIVDCIDYEKSEYKVFENSGKIMWIHRHAFKEEKVKMQHLFKIPDMKRGCPYVSDEFRNRVLEAGLTAFRFTCVWDSEEQ